MAQGGRKIVIGVDESAFSEQAFNFYVENFLREDDTLFLVHTPERYNFVDASTAVLHELYDEINKKVRALENKYQEKIKAAGIKSSKFVTKQGGPGEAIVAVADKEKANMIVTGCRGMGIVRRTLLGSVSDYVLHHSHCPVLVCRK
ncbi:universal stress protein in QAH/OAS sulfhydrylase 3'region-like isoform X4 [Saccostrea echinata]|uniref:universal stress protein in QAH/OAS sulfhydrylase 3'region-like isoform X4 n=1 Tax=Saccostrea echinata TaxID=191078 RepID=UPI002A811D03|nr:universal stress protein in QAH/OAS sulfhydrylase 3'region-like isoform X4 [Saccostrea echinata]